MKILLNRFKSKESTDSEMNIGLSLKSTQMEIPIEDVNALVDEYEQFSMERQLNFNYFLHGKIEVLVDSGYGIFPYFNNSTLLTLNESNWDLSFVYPFSYTPDTEYVINIKSVSANKIVINTTYEINLDDIIMGIGTDKEFYKVISIINVNSDIELTLDRNMVNKTSIVPSFAKYFREYKEISLNVKYYDCGLAVNIFNSPIRLFNITKDLNIEGLYDEFNFPLSTGYFKMINKNLEYTNYVNDSLVAENILDSIYFDLNNITIDVIDTVKSKFNVNSTEFWMNKYFPMEFKKFSETVEEGNTETTSNIPYYAFNFGDSTSKWKDVLDIGFYQDGIGVDYPYMNKLHYLYSDFKIIVNRSVALDLGTQSDIDDILEYNDTASSIINNYC